MSSPTFLSAGGAEPVEVPGETWKTVATMIYPGEQLHGRGLVPHKLWVCAAASDGSVGLQLRLQDNMGTLMVGPSTTYSGSGVLQSTALSPLRVQTFRHKGPPQVLLLQARNGGPVSQPSSVGQFALELRDK